MIWEKVKAGLEESVAENIYSLWFEPLEFVQLKGERLYISSPDRYFSAYVRQNFSTHIEEQLTRLGLTTLQVVFCEENRLPEKRAANEKSSSKKQLRLPTVPQNISRCKALHPRYTFDEFMVGECNILAESACRSIVADDGLVGPCLYINSDTGLGKSHLTHAVAHQVFADSPMTRLHYLTAKQFAAEMINGIQNRTMGEFKRKYQDQCDILLVEDVHSLTGKKKTQEELNDILDTLIKSGKKIILTSNRSPHELIGIDNEFRSRMTSGLVTAISAPGVKTRCGIIEKKAAQQQLLLEDGHVDYLAHHIRGDVRKIESALIAIGAKAKLAGGHIDMDLVKTVVASIVGGHQLLTTAMICDLISGQFKVTVKELQSKSRKKAITVPRQIAMYLARKHTEESLVDIGKTFNRDHSTVLHSIKVVSNMLVRDGSVNAQLELLDNKVRQL
ncbi:MAG: chromosomal replication initiator protein DnaA [Desulforhopalus sp.]